MTVCEQKRQLVCEVWLATFSPALLSNLKATAQQLVELNRGLPAWWSVTQCQNNCMPRLEMVLHWDKSIQTRRESGIPISQADRSKDVPRIDCFLKHKSSICFFSRIKALCTVTADCFKKKFQSLLFLILVFQYTSAVSDGTLGDWVFPDLCLK